MMFSFAPARPPGWAGQTRPSGSSDWGLGRVFADDRDSRNIGLREATEVVRQAEEGVLLALALAGTALHLQVHLIDHAQARGADRMAKAFEATVDLAGDPPVCI